MAATKAALKKIILVLLLSVFFHRVLCILYSLFCQNARTPALSSVMASEPGTDPFNSAGVPTALPQMALKSSKVTVCYILDI